ncbi:MAG: beta-ketoacyl-[acyl-carrier-protein] synthase family protein [Planctomycetes bacterium]|nr:beta-ketoacyl-[acyl-carrier-protein] synthase family protein [Planctomycetota bacterium]
MKSAEAIWITGVGVGTPLGWDFKTVARNLLDGESGIRTITSFDVSQQPSQIAGEIDSITCPAGWDPARFAQLSRLEQMCLWCGSQALRDAGLWDIRGDKRVGLILANASEWGMAWETDVWSQKQAIACDPTKDSLPLLGMLQEQLGVSGPVLTMSAACASGNFTLAQARRWLELGWVDLCLAGGCDMAVTPLTMAGFGNLRALSRLNDRPQAASRPFDRARDGFVLGEGGAMFVLERASSARARGAHVYGELAACGMTSDAYHPVMPAPEPVHAIAAIRQALKNARIDPSDVDYVNAHGTSTPVGDIAEAKALRQVFGERTRTIPVSATKSMTGHLLTAASAFEALACLATFDYSAIPPTINLDDPDPECELNHVAHRAMERPVRIAISNSFGFGGSNSCAVFRAA